MAIIDEVLIYICTVLYLGEVAAAATQLAGGIGVLELLGPLGREEADGGVAGRARARLGEALDRLAQLEEHVFQGREAVSLEQGLGRRLGEEAPVPHQANLQTALKMVLIKVHTYLIGKNYLSDFHVN